MIHLGELVFNAKDVSPTSNRKATFGGIAEKIIRLLQDNNLYEINLKYRFIDENRITYTKKHGTDRTKKSETYGASANPKDITFVASEGDGTNEDKHQNSVHEQFSSIETAFGFVNSDSSFGVLVYRGNNLSIDCLITGRAYIKPGTKPIAIIKCRYIRYSGF